jgi:hypothetical protein
MVSYVYLASAGATLALAVIVFVAIDRGRDWHSYRPSISPPQPSSMRRLAGDVRTWTLLFAVLVLATTAGILSALQGGSTTAILAVFGVVVLGFVTLGVYGLGRSRGHPHAAAVGEALVTIGLILLVALSGQLLTGFGA